MCLSRVSLPGQGRYRWLRQVPAAQW